MKSSKKKSKSGSRPAKGNSAVPLAVDRNYIPTVPKTNGQEKFIVSHREFVADVTSVGDTLNTTSYSINPGLAGTFPWLHHLAQNFESYRFRQLKIEYNPIAPATQAGTVMLAVDFDSADAAPLSKSGMMSFQNAVTGPVWSSKNLNSTQPNLHKMVSERYVRGGSLAANLDVKTYDVGNLIVATANTGVYAGICGEIFVSYTVELLTPQYNITQDAADNSMRYSIAGALNLATPCGVVPVATTGSLPITVESDGIVFQEAGDFLLNLQGIGTVFTSTPGIAVNGADVVWTVISNVIDAAATFHMASVRVRCPRRGGKLFFDYTGHATTLTAFAIRAARYLYTLT